jgi:hypothetical protein
MFRDSFLCGICGGQTSTDTGFFFQYFVFLPVSVIPPMLNTRSLIYHRRSITGVAKTRQVACNKSYSGSLNAKEAERERRLKQVLKEGDSQLTETKHKQKQGPIK